MLTDHFTRAELLAAAEAAEPYPPEHANDFGVTETGEGLLWNERERAVFL